MANSRNLAIALLLTATGVAGCGKGGSSLAKAAATGAATVVGEKVAESLLSDNEPRTTTNENPFPGATWTQRNHRGGIDYWYGTQPLGFTATDRSGRLRVFLPNGMPLR